MRGIRITETIEITLTIPKRYYVIAMEIESLPECSEKNLKYSNASPKEVARFNAVYAAFQTKHNKIFKKHKITTNNQRKAISRARTILQLGGQIK